MKPSPKRAKRLLTCVFILPLVAAALSGAVSAPGARASNLAGAQQKLAEAQAEADKLGNQISREGARLSAAQAAIAGLQGEISLAEAEYDKILAKLDQIQKDLDDTQSQFDTLDAEMNARAATTYMQGPGSDLEFLLSSSSIADLSARVEYIDALQSQDADHSEQLSSLSRLLADTRKHQADLLRVSRDALKVLNDRNAELKTRTAEMQAIVSQLKAEQEAAQKLEAKWEHKVKVIIQATGGTGGPSPFDVCPVPGFTWIADDFGAIRYTTVPPHSHQGNDIGAPYGSPIVAPFAGTATNSSNSLGGTSVSVQGAAGYVYNAHLSKLGKLGHVEPGDIVGYIGMSGDAQGTVPHDHFEWHPGGGNAVDPHAYLLAVC